MLNLKNKKKSSSKPIFDINHSLNKIKIKNIKMANTIIESNLDIVIHDGGLNSIYDEFKNKFMLYDDLLSSIIEFNYNSEENSNQEKNLNTLKINEVIKSFSNLNKNTNSIIFNNQELNELCAKFNCHLNYCFANSERKSKTELLINSKNFESAEIELISRYDGKNIILLHDNLVSLLADYIVLKNLNLDENFIFVYNNKHENQTEFMNLILKSPKNCIFYSRYLEILFEYKCYGVWTVYLTSYIFTTEHKIKKNKNNENHTSQSDRVFDNLEYINSINESNKNFMRKKGRFFDFAHISFNCSFNYLKLIHEVNQQNTDSKADLVKLQERINESNPIKVLILAKALFKFREFQRSLEYYVSDERIIYNFYCGFDQLEEFHLNGEFEIIFFKITRTPEIEYFSELSKTALVITKRNPKIYLANPADNLEYFNDRGEMVKWLNHIAGKTSDLTAEFKTELIIPDSKLVNLKLINSKENFRKFLQENNLNLPLILKIDGSFLDHYMCSIVADKGIDNFIEYFNNNTANGFEDKINILIQSFFNHGGKVIKSYFINKTAYTYIRPSLPDMLEEYCSTIKEFENGYFCFCTPDLVSKKFEEFTKKFHIDNEIDKKIDYNFLQKICSVFEKESEKTLFGLDFLYNSEKNVYSLIDCNYFPGYKEFKGGLGKIIKEHLLNYYQDHIKKLKEMN